MIRCLLVIVFWILTVGIFDINVIWADGTKITLKGWGTWLQNKIK